MENNNFGFILLDKPSGPTSHGMVSFLRRLTGIKRIGHAGTLDPFASGLLIMGVGRQATKLLDRFLKQDKEYEALLLLGKTTDTFDREGKVTSEYSGSEISGSVVEKIVKGFIGKQEQVPPMFSAKKVGGKKLYELARAGKTIERKPANVEIHKISVLDYSWPYLKIIVKCSSGTYIRSLADDIGRSLECGAYLEELRRTAIGEYRVEKAVRPEELNPDNWTKSLWMP